MYFAFYSVVPATSCVPLMVRLAHSKLQERAVYHQGTNSTFQEAIRYINGKASGGVPTI